MTAPAATHLGRIVEAHRRAAAADTRSVDALIDAAKAQPAPRGFAAGLRAAHKPAIIAEIKRRSPVKGNLRVDLDAAQVGRAYQAGGAACLSVLTDDESFGGSADDLRTARAATSLPVLRKDFTVSAADVCDARLMGADAVLLIVAALDDVELGAFRTLAVEVGLDALVEVHDEAELERALAVGADLVGVNQRDLATFHVDRGRAARLSKAIPPGVTLVGESGIRDAADVAALLDAGVHAVLVGETLVTADDPTVAVKSLRQASKPDG